MERLKNFIDGLRFDFVGKRWLFSSASGVLVLLSWIAFVAIGPRWGIDFTGGTEIRLRFAEATEAPVVRESLASLGLSDDSVQTVGADGREFVIRIQDTAFGTDKLQAEVRQRLDAAFGAEWIQELKVESEVGARMVVGHAGTPVTVEAVQSSLAGLDWAKAVPSRQENQVVIQLSGVAERVGAQLSEVLGAERPFELLSLESVGPRVGAELRRDGFLALAFTLALVLVYVAFRFDLAFAPGAILALIHDVSLTAGVFVVTQMEFSVSMIGALLTIVGYSLNDTIVVYDRIRENRDRYRRKEFVDLINTSINETLTRTIATNGATMMAITPMMFMGGPVIETFAIAMFCGIIFGTYSTIYVASPMILIIEDLKPWLARFVALPELGGPPAEEPVGDGPQTESERRRRERAEAERRLKGDDVVR